MPRYVTSRPAVKFDVDLWVGDLFRPSRTTSHPTRTTGTAVCNAYPEACEAVSKLKPGDEVNLVLDDGTELVVRRVIGRLVGTPHEQIQQRIDLLRFERALLGEEGEHRPKGKPLRIRPKIGKRYRRQAVRAIQKQGVNRRRAAEILYLAAQAPEDGEED